VSWDQQFFDPIELPKGRKLVTFRDAAPDDVRPDRRYAGVEPFNPSRKDTRLKRELTPSCRPSLRPKLLGEPK